jgi:hypothetical protein
VFIPWPYAWNRCKWTVCLYSVEFLMFLAYSARKYLCMVLCLEGFYVAFVWNIMGTKGWVHSRDSRNQAGNACLYPKACIKEKERICILTKPRTNLSFSLLQKCYNTHLFFACSFTAPLFPYLIPRFFFTPNITDSEPCLQNFSPEICFVHNSFRHIPFFTFYSLFQSAFSHLWSEI